MIQCYFGDGKGKTTAAIGAAIRCAGSGSRVLFVRFLKNNDSAEFNIIENIKNIDVMVSKERYTLYDNENESLKNKYRDTYTELLFKETANVIKMYRMVILDEILDATEFGYVDTDELAELLKDNKDKTEIILTGHKLPEKIAKLSDYISEIKAINHPYNFGAPPRKGIEY